MKKSKGKTLPEIKIEDSKGIFKNQIFYKLDAYRGSITLNNLLDSTTL